MTRDVDTPCTAPLDASELTVGDQVLERAIRLTRADLIAYAGASGDHNPIHWNQAFAESVGLPGVIAHGMWGGALISGVLGTRLPGAGTIYRSQTLRFLAPVRIGDRLAIQVTVVATDPATRGVTLACTLPVLGSNTSPVRPPPAPPSSPR